MARDRDDDLAREIRTHLELEAEQRAAEGVPEADARLAARRAFGSVARTQEDVRAVWRRGPVESLRRDLTFGVRTMARRPGSSPSTTVSRMISSRLTGSKIGDSARGNSSLWAKTAVRRT